MAGIIRNQAQLAFLALRDPALLLSSGHKPEDIQRVRLAVRYQPPLAYGSREEQMMQHVLFGRESAALEQLKAGGFNLHSTDEVGRGYLHHATQMGMLKLSEELILRGVPVDAQAVTGETPLAYTISCNAHASKPLNHLHATMELLLHYYAHTDLPDMQGTLPDTYAARHGDIAALHLLKPQLKQFAPASLQAAVLRYHPQAVGYLLWSGVDPRGEDKYGYSLRERAQITANGNSTQARAASEIVGKLARAEVIADAREVAGLPVAGQDLITHVFNNMEAFCQVASLAMMASDGAKLNAALDILGDMQDMPRPEPRSAVMRLHHAAQQNLWVGIVNAIEDGAPVDGQDHHGRTALHRAIINNQPEAASYLLEQMHANPNVPDVLGMTPLMYACLFGREGAVPMLLTRGADPLMKNWQGRSARQLIATFMGDLPPPPAAASMVEATSHLALMLFSAEQHWVTAALRKARSNPQYS